MTTAIERLEQLLDEKDKQLDELQLKLYRLEDTAQSAEAGWSLPREVPDDHPELPLPRLELAWKQRTPGSWSSYRVEYRLVRRHLCDHVVITPLGSTQVDGGGLDPFASGAERALPFRDGAHVIHDAAHLELPAYALTPTGPERIDNLLGYQYQRESGTKRRRAAKGAP